MQAHPEAGRCHKSNCIIIRPYRRKRRGRALEMSALQVHHQGLQAKTWHYKMQMVPCELVEAMQPTPRHPYSTNITTKSLNYAKVSATVLIL
jgi:hypothetical protein